MEKYAEQRYTCRGFRSQWDFFFCGFGGVNGQRFSVLKETKIVGIRIVCGFRSLQIVYEGKGRRFRIVLGWF